MHSCRVANCLAIVLVCVPLALSQGNCTFPKFNITFNFLCPNGTQCVVDDRSDAPNQLLMSKPAGCCPVNLTKGCFSNNNLNGIDGCCGENQTCCYTSPPLRREWVGCVDWPSQCCINQICPTGYFCCITPFAHTCCPNGTSCYSQNFRIGSPAANFTALFNITFGADLCIPLPGGNVIPANRFLNDVNLTTGRNATSGDVLLSNWNVSIPNVTSANVTKCGRHLCFANDTCIERFLNNTFQNYTLNTSIPECAIFSPNPTLAFWPDYCVIRTPVPKVTIRQVGCCPTNYTPCGPNEFSFQPVPAELPQLQNVAEPFIGCASPEESCCYPTICPSGMKCCNVKWTYFGTSVPTLPFPRPLLVNTTAAQRQNISLFTDFVSTFSKCCPVNTTCCQMQVPYKRPGQTNLPWQYGDFFQFCGTDDTCTRDAFTGDLVGFRYNNTFISTEENRTQLSILNEKSVSITRVQASGPLGNPFPCFPSFNGKSYANIPCASLGGNFKSPAANTPLLPLSPNYLSNSDPTMQVVIENFLNATIVLEGLFPRPP